MFNLFSKMSKVCAAGEIVRGIDVSHYDEQINWRKVKDAGIAFSFMKATEGTRYRDKTFHRNWNDARSAGILCGAYHFFRPGVDAKAQADNFLNYIEGSYKGLPPVLDWESTDGVPNSADRRSALIFLNEVEKKTNRVPIVYTSPYFAQALGLGSEFARYPLWVAHYGVNCPLVPPPWKNWTFWQLSEKGNVPGIPAPDEDMDVFNGTLDQLKALAGVPKIG